MSDSSVESRVEEQVMPAMRIVGLLVFLVAAGCTEVERAPPLAGSPQGEAVAVEPSVTGSTGQDAAKTESPAATAPAK